jgi:hypothetical protein
MRLEGREILRQFQNDLLAHYGTGYVEETDYFRAGRLVQALSELLLQIKKSWRCSVQFCDLANIEL